MAEHRLMTDAEYAEMEERRNKTFDRIDFLVEALFQKHNCSQSSSRGAMNSCQETLQQPLHSNYISTVVESSREIKLRTEELSREIKQSYTRMINLLQEEIDATNNSVPTSAKTLSSMESIDEKSTEESIGVRTSMVRADSESVDNNSLPMLNETFKRHFVSGDDYVGLTITMETADALLVPTVLLPSTEQMAPPVIIDEDNFIHQTSKLRKVQVTQISESSNNPISYVSNVQVTDHKKLEDDVVTVPLLHDATHYFTTHVLTIHNFPYDPGSFETPAAIPKVSNPRDSLQFEQEVMSHTLSHFEIEIYPQTITILWKTNNGARVATGSLVIPISVCPIVIHMLSACGFFGYGTCAFDAYNNYMSSCEAHNVFVKMPLKTNFSWGPLTSFLIRMHIHAFFVQDDMVPWIQVLLCGSVHRKVVPARSLMQLLENSGGVWAVLFHGSMPTLLSNCGVLRNIVGGTKIHGVMGEEGLVSMLIMIFKSNDDAVQVHYIWCIHNMASRDVLVGPKVGLCFLSSVTATILKGCDVVNQPLYSVIIGDVSIQKLAMKVAFKFYETSEEHTISMDQNSHYQSSILNLCLGIHDNFCGLSSHGTITLTEVFESLVDVHIHALLELLEEFAMVPHFDQLGFEWLLRIVDIRVGPYINALLELYNLLELSIDELESIVDVNLHDLLELSEGFPWMPSINQLDIEWLFRVNDIVAAILQKFYIIFSDGKQLYIFQEVYAATMLYSYLDFWYIEVFMVSVLTLPPYWFYVWCGLVDMGYKLVTMLRECKVVIWSVVLLECNSVGQLEESIAKNFIELEQTGLSTKLAALLLAILNTCTWDPGGNGYFFYTEWSLQFHQWDPGGCSLVHGKVHLTWKQRKDITITQQTLSQP